MILVQKSLKSERSSRFFGCLKILGFFVGGVSDSGDDDNDDKDDNGDDDVYTGRVANVAAFPDLVMIGFQP